MPVSLKSVPVVAQKAGFTLIELILTLILISILGAISITAFMDLSTDARNAATKGALGGIRAAIGIARATIALREDTGVAPYPRVGEMQANRYHVSYHPVLSGLYIMDSATQFPNNPWTLSTLPNIHFRSVVDCAALSIGMLRSTSGADFRGWCYNENTGEAWANSDRNGGGPARTENYY